MEKENLIEQIHIFNGSMSVVICFTLMNRMLPKLSNFGTFEKNKAKYLRLFNSD